MGAYPYVWLLSLIVVSGSVAGPATAQNAETPPAAAAPQELPPQNWHMLEDQASARLESGDVAGTVDLLGRHFFDYAFPTPKMEMRCLMRVALEAAWARSDAPTAAQAALWLARSDCFCITWSLPKRGLKFAQVAQSLSQRSGLDPAQVETVIDHLKQMLGEDSDKHEAKAEDWSSLWANIGGLFGSSSSDRLVSEAVASASDRLEKQGSVAIATNLDTAYQLAEKSETLLAEQQAAQLCAGIVAQLPTLPSEVWDEVISTCARLGGAVAGNEVVEGSWVATMNALLPNLEDEDTRKLFFTLARQFPVLVETTARPASAQNLVRSAELYEQILAVSGRRPVQDRDLASLYMAAALNADRRDLPELARRATLGALRCMPQGDWARGESAPPLQSLGVVPADLRRYTDLLVDAVIDEALAAKDVQRAIGVTRAVLSRGGLEWAEWAASTFERIGSKDLGREVRTRAAGEFVARDELARAGRLLLPVVDEAIEAKDYANVVALTQPIAQAIVQDPKKSSHRGYPALQCCMRYAQAQQELGDTSNADAALRAVTEGLALGMTDEGATPHDVAAAMLEAASLATSSGLKSALLQQAFSTGAQQADTEIVLGALTQQAELVFASGNMDAAKKCLLDLINLTETRRGRLLYIPELRQQWFEQVQKPYELLLAVACAQDDADLALVASEYKRSRTFLEQLRERQLDFDKLIPSDLRSWRDELREKRSKVYAALAARRMIGAADEGRGAYIPVRGEGASSRDSYIPLGGEELAPEGQESLRAQMEMLAAEEAKFDAALREKVPGYDQAVVNAPPPASQLTRLVRNIQGLLVIEYSLAHGSYLSVAVPAWTYPVSKVIEKDAKAVDDLVTEFRSAVAAQDEARTASASRALYDKLIAPFEDLLGSAKMLLIVADASLHLLPFEALCGPDGQPLIARLEVCYTPSLTVLGQARRVEEAPQQGLLALGNPTFNTAVLPESPGRGAYMPVRSPSGTAMVADAVRALAATPLPGTEAEIQGIASLFPSHRLLSQSQATKQALLQNAQYYRVIHLATHGYADTERPDYSSILLAPEGPNDAGLLQAFEIYDMRLQADLVALSACETGVGRAVLGEGVLGLPRAFFFAGVKEVLCSLWKVPDRSTAELMQSFYRHWTAGETTIQALRAAKLELLAKPETSSPFHWAAFIVVEGPQG